MIIHSFAVAVLLFKIKNSGAADITTATTSKVAIVCRQHGTVYAIKCELGGVGIDVSSGHTMILESAGNNAAASAAGTTVKHVEGSTQIATTNSITIFVDTDIDKHKYRCYVQKTKTPSQTSKKDTSLVKFTDHHYCVKNVRSTLLVTKEAEKKYSYKCFLSGGPEIDVSKGHKLYLEQKGNPLKAPTDIKKVSATKTSITWELSTYDETKRDEFKCQIEDSDRTAHEGSEKSPGAVEVPPCPAAHSPPASKEGSKKCNSASSSIANSLVLTLGCLAVSLLKLKC